MASGSTVAAAGCPCTSYEDLERLEKEKRCLEDDDDSMAGGEEADVKDEGEEKRARERAQEPLRRDEREEERRPPAGLPYIQLFGSQWDFSWK